MARGMALAPPGCAVFRASAVPPVRAKPRFAGAAGLQQTAGLVERSNFVGIRDQKQDLWRQTAGNNAGRDCAMSCLSGI